MPQGITCGKCGKRYALETSPPATFACRACGATLRATDLRASVPPMRAESGAVPGRPGRSLARSSTRRRAPDASIALSPEERHAAARELGQAMKFVRALKDSYLAGAILLSLVAGAGLLVTGLGVHTLGSLALLAVMVFGIFRFDRSPARWSLVLALLGTGFVALTLVERAADQGGRMSVGLGDAFNIFVVIGYWTAVGLARRVESVARRYPDLWLARRLHGSTAEDEHEGMGTRHRDRAGQERRSRRRRLAVLGGILVAGIALLVLVAPKAAEGPPSEPLPEVPVDAFAARFRDAWNAGRLAEVKAAFQPQSREKFSKGLDSILRRRGWIDHLPVLGPPRLVPDGAYAAAHFPLPDDEGDLYTSWAYDAKTKTWAVNALRPPARGGG